MGGGGEPKAYIGTDKQPLFAHGNTEMGMVYLSG